MKIRIPKLFQFLIFLLGLIGKINVAHSQGADVSLVNKVVASDRTASDFFGWDVGISGNYAVAGAWQEKHNVAGTAELKDAGSVYFYEKENGVWVQKQKVVASDRAINNRFGYSVDIDGATAVVSAYGAANGGAIYIFERGSDAKWTQKQRITNPVTTGYFGWKVVIKGNTIAVSDPQNKTNASGGASLNAAGAIFIYEKQESGTWAQKQKVVPLDRAANDKFGEVFDYSGDYLVTGKEAETKDLSGGNNIVLAGAIYIFEKNSTDAVWAQKSKIVANDRSLQLYFGRSVAVDGNTIAVGAIGGKPVGATEKIYAGAVYLYERNSSGTWEFKQKIGASDREYNDQFGEKIAISGKYIIVGAENEGDVIDASEGISLSYGAAYLFEKDANGSWLERKKITAPVRKDLHLYSFAIDIDGLQVMVGSPWDDLDANGATSRNQSGSAYVYNIEPPVPVIDHTNAFITTWDTDKLPNGYYISFNITGSNLEYYWEKIGDEANTNSGTYLVNANVQSIVLQQLATGTGAYKIYIKPGSGTFTGFQTYGHAGQAAGLTAVNSWGNVVWTNLMGAFTAAKNLTSLPATAPNLSQVTDLSFMFAGAESFNQNISHWNVNNITKMSVMFQGATSFNQDISGWNVGNVTDMARMFNGVTSFNQNISGWDVSKVTDMWKMFNDASNFNQNLGSWVLKTGTDLTNMLDNSGLNSTNYGLTLKGWAENANSPTNLTLGALGLKYKEESQQYRDVLTNQKSWVIIDGGVLPVTMLGFAVKLSGSAVNLKWTTASEQNNKTFVVSRSADGKNFTELTQIAGAGNSSTQKSYAYNDRSPLNGANYYRLEQIDLDGKINLVGVEVVNFKLSAPSVTVYPNPTANEINVAVPEEFGGNLEISIFDMTGKRVYGDKFSSLQMIYQLRHQQLPSGKYIVRVKSDLKNESIKILVK